MRTAGLALALLLTARVFAEDAQVLVLGVFHFGNPGLDYVKSSVPDVLTEERQKEIAEIVARLARFEPTAVLVEKGVATNEALNARYRAFREGKHELSRDEVEQFGFRLAAAMKHGSIHAIDVKTDMDLDGVMAEAKKSDPAFMTSFAALMKDLLEPQNRMQVERPLRETLRFINDPANVKRGHEVYVEMARIGSPEHPVGAEQTAVWYARNIRIFANLARMAKPGDRIVVIYGSGHTAILQQLIRDMPGMKVVEANDFL
ncbi:MAG: DUF5694 domain-containing protein [Thermoanaerobaculia bacterium]